ncbi:serine hydrolase [Occallatibacter riparius]|uniref:Serine hydrolase n=1 Tax=Occallatibacter riparius TaxID=1002689 RepID=A0A9J7BMJ7_9BACT|nr:serine hydrolase [Occallatibacter riparius]UWZ83960.1 serine hydrolase [Occallatibacter riparius]
MKMFQGRNPGVARFSLLLGGLFASGIYGRGNQSALQRMQAVQSHLSRYVTIRGDTNGDMQLESQMKARRVPAVSIAVVRNGAIDWARAYGVSSLDGGPVSTRTLFGAASISKAVTALGVLKLVEEGKIDLDANVNHYLKRWKIPDNEYTANRKVTVRELLNHTSGIGTHNGEIYDSASPIPTLLQLLEGEKPARTPAVRVEAVPGTKFAYSNGGYLVLTLLIEDVTGQPFAAYMRRAVLDPIGMTHSTFDAPLPLEWRARAATAYGADGKWAVPPSKYVEPNLGAGGLWSTPTDLAKLLIEIQREYEGRSHKVLRQETMRRMVMPDKEVAAPRRWGLGLEVGGSMDNPYIRHEGSGYFQDDMVEYLHGNGIVVMTSGGGGAGLAEEVIRSAGTVYDLPDFKPVEHSVVDVPDATLRAYTGTYAYIKVAMEDGHLTAEIPSGSPAVRLYPESATQFFVLDGPQELSFFLDSEKHVTGVDFIVPMGHHRLERTPER